MGISHMNDFESFYDNQIETEINEDDSIADLLQQKAPTNNLCSAIDPDGEIVGLSGNDDIFSSPQAAFFEFFKALYLNKDKLVSDVLNQLGVDLYYIK